MTPHHIEIALAEASRRVFGDFIERRDILLGAFIVGAFVGKKQVKLDLRVVYGFGREDFIEVVPFAHDLFVLVEVGRDRSLEKRSKSLD